MSRYPYALTFAFIAAPLFAQQQQQAPPPAPAPAPAVAPAPQVVDSPLVALAKKTNRTQSKAKIVITNDTLVKSGGHITTTATAPPQLPEMGTTPDPAQAQRDAALKQQQAVAAAEAQRKVQQQKMRAQAAAADYYGSSIESMNPDPARAEGAMQQYAVTTTSAPQDATATTSTPQASQNPRNPPD